MLRGRQLLWVLALAVASTAAFPQATSGTGAGTALGEPRGPGLTSPPNNALPPIGGINPVTPGPVTPGLNSAPSVSPLAPSTGSTTALTPGLSSPAPGTVIELPPPALNPLPSLPSSSSGSDAPRSCPSGVTFC
jgi:hypothetical protein